MHSRAMSGVRSKQDKRGSAAKQKRRGGGRGQERVRLLQLLICLLLFLAVFCGKGVFPGKAAQVREAMLSLLSSDINFYAAFSRVGEALAKDPSLTGPLGDFYLEVFGPAEEAVPEKTAAVVPELTSLMAVEQAFLSQNLDDNALSTHYFSSGHHQVILEFPTETQQDQENEQPAVAAAGTVLMKSDYSGKPLPENYTMDQLSLGGLETATPVLGHINSPYGYRDHPINGKHQFHGGLDIGAQSGDTIQAFAAGRVEYVGEDKSYGLYLQLDHGNGIKSFYAHCKKICVKKGQEVALGEKIAEVGSSGSATGPHLHLELKYNKTHLDPTYYIDCLSSQ